MKIELGTSQLNRLIMTVSAVERVKARRELKGSGRVLAIRGHNVEAPWETIAGEVSVMLNTQYRTCNLTKKYEYAISPTHSTACTLPHIDIMTIGIT